ncbi:hypothetical protein [Parvularcula sp. IMCC14364]|uniref:hypothetical protein n=1 Tax=Parvularcula sp. IMCC14364 TaxID=3067902 RepID=UPI0027418E1D|nr:hypothetical protein [Parvularcula sp. IMCC14364]
MSEAQREKDLSRRLLPFALLWGIPIILLCSANFLEEFFSAAPIILIMAGAYIWMGVGCIINAMQCGRLHCYLAGPVMVLGGSLIFAVGFDLISFGPIRVMHLSYTTIALVALTFVLEWLLGAYTKRANS